MPIDPSTALAGAEIVTGLFGAIFGKEADNGRLKFTPAQEIEYIKSMQSTLDQANKDIERTTRLESAYNKRLDIVDGIIKGTIPNEQALKDLTSAANDIAMAFGSPEEAKARGYLTENDYNDLQALRDMESENFVDPVLDNQLKSEKAALEQDLARKGISPAQRLQALNQFNRLADERKFTRNEELKTGKTGRTLARVETGANLRQQAFGNIQTQIGNALTGAGALANSANMRQNVGSAAIAARTALGQQKSDLYKTLGKTEIRGGQPAGSAGTTAGNFGASNAGNGTVGPTPGQVYGVNSAYAPADPLPVLSDSQVSQSGINQAARRKLRNVTRT